MGEFEKILLRLKEQLGIHTDKEVAGVLGISPTAFNDRKKRDSFPKDKLLALKVSKPELVFDADYVLTGRSPERDARQAEINQQHYLSVQRDAEKYLKASGVAEIESSEYRLAVLGGKFIRLDEESRRAVENMIDLLLAKK